MKRFTILLAVFLFSAVLQAQPIQVQKSTFISKEASTFHANQVFATNTRTDMTLVVWERVTSSNREILGRLLNAKGIPGSPRFTLASGTVAHPAVIYNTARNEFLLAYDNNPQPQLVRSDIFVVRLNAQGRPSGTASKVSTDSVSVEMANFNPHFAYNSRTSTMVLLWLREIASSSQADDGTNGLVGVQLTGGGSVSGSTVLLQKTVIESNRLWGPIPLDATFHPNNNKLLITTVQVQSGTQGQRANYYLGTMNADFSGISNSTFAQVNTAQVDVTGGFAWGSQIAFMTNTAGVIYFVDTSNIRRRKIDASGNLSGSIITAFRPPKNNTRLLYPSVAFSTVNSIRRGLLLAIENVFSESGAATFWAQPLDANGAALGAPIKVDTTASNETALSTQLLALPPLQNLTGYRFSALYTAAEFTTPGQNFQTSGLVKLNLTIPAK